MTVVLGLRHLCGLALGSPSCWLRFRYTIHISAHIWESTSTYTAHISIIFTHNVTSANRSVLSSTKSLSSDPSPHLGLLRSTSRLCWTTFDECDTVGSRRGKVLGGKSVVALAWDLLLPAHTCSRVVLSIAAAVDLMVARRETARAVDK